MMPEVQDMIVLQGSYLSLRHPAHLELGRWTDGMRHAQSAHTPPMFRIIGCPKISRTGKWGDATP